ncbi:TetR/AcrR family transcriptional regulator [Streptomyces sp. NPDC057702]|uniref:TetR/AcrR family transcriptional regulator n=1 Tax=unclassified Streptomyces TaxID=2593676 RepID=UPI0036C1BA7D
MPPDSTATKARLLAAALGEFAQHGVAGARVDRIALSARANKRLLYVYFGNKRELFDIVVAATLDRLASEVPYVAGDLPGYAGALFDHLTARPAVLRLVTWAFLERPEPLAARVAACHPVAEDRSTAPGHRAGAGTLEPLDVLALTVGLASACSLPTAPPRPPATSSAWCGAARGAVDATALRARRRAALTRAVSAAAGP